MNCPTLAEIPSPPLYKTGWPWTEATPQLKTIMPDGSPWPRISIVTPSYNQGQFIEETIRSVLLQGYPNLEYIIIDGGSTDNSVEIIKKYEPWLTYWVSENDRGQSHAINKGFERCTGDIITYQNSDDIYLTGTFMDVGSRWSQLQHCGAIVGGFYYMDNYSRLDQVFHPPRLPHEGPIDLTLGPPGIYRMHQVSTFYTKTALDEVGRWVREELSYTMDRDLLYRICRNSKILLANQGYGAFRRHDNSKSVADILPFAREFAELYLSFQANHSGENKRRKRMACYRRAYGYLKYARQNGTMLYSAAALVAALFYQPSYAFRSGYIATWLDVLHLSSIVKKALQMEVR